MAHLILVRHGQSTWNKLGKWTGYVDVDLTDKGIEEARKAGELLKGISVDKVYSSALKRAHQTYDEIKKVLNIPHEAVKHPALNERHYGVRTGQNKWEVAKDIGEAEFQNIRRGWDSKIPEGETLKDVHARVVPYFLENILPNLQKGDNVLVVAHGNSLRAILKHVENINMPNRTYREIY